MNMGEVITIWINNLWRKSNMPACNKPVRIQCKAGSVSARFVKQEPSVRTFWSDLKMIVSPTKLKVHFAKAEPISQSASPPVRQSKSVEDREIGKQFPPLCKVLAEKLKVLFPERDDKHIHCPCTQHTITSSQYQGSQKRRGETSVQTCFFGKRTDVCLYCS